MVRTIPFLIITIGALSVVGCDGRPLGPEQPDGGAMVDQGTPGKPLPDASMPDTNENNSEGCVIAVRQGGCCDSVEAATVEQVKNDPCLFSREVDTEYTNPCRVEPGPCAQECPSFLRPPSYRVAPAPGGGCQFVSECASEDECGMYYNCPGVCITDYCNCGGGGNDSDEDCGYPAGALPNWYAENHGCQADQWGTERPSDPAPPYPGPFAVCASSPTDSHLMVCTRTEEEIKPPPSTRYLLWQSFSGVAGTGPALEVYGDSGSVRIWINSGHLQPRTAVGWDFETTWSQTEINSFFMSLEAIDMSALPHPVPAPGFECSASFYLDLNNGSSLNFGYGSATNLSPEFDAIYSWLAQVIWPYQNLLPGNYCSFETLTIECGNHQCDPLTEVCVLRPAPSAQHPCQPVPPGCEMDRSCACLGDEVCPSTYSACLDTWENDVVICEYID